MAMVQNGRKPRREDGLTGGCRRQSRFVVHVIWVTILVIIFTGNFVSAILELLRVLHWIVTQLGPLGM